MNSNFGTGGVLVATLVAFVLATPWLGYKVAIAGLVLFWLTYVQVLGAVNRHYRPDGTPKRPR